MATSRWYLDQTKKDGSNPDIFSNTWRQTIEQTQAWMDNLRQSTIDSSISNVWIRSDLTIQQRWLEYERDMHTLVWFLSVVDKLLEEIEDTKSWLSKKWLSKAWKKTIKEAKTKLNQYEKQLKAKRKALSKQGRAEIYDNDISHLRDLRQQVNKVRQDIWMWQWWDFASTASYLYNSPEIARKSNEHQADNLEFEQKLQTEVKKWAILHIFNWVEHKANEFYRRIAEWRYTRADYELFITNSAVLTPSFQRCGIAIPTWPIQSSWRVERVSWSTRRSVDYSNMDWWETLEKWWVAGVLDKLLSNCSNMTPWQRNTWKTLWVLGIIGWVIYWQYKFYTSKNIWLGTKIWLTILPIFGSQFLTWEDPITLFRKLMTGWLSMDELKNKFGNAVWWLSSSWSEVAETTVPAMQSMMIFNSWATAGDVQQMTRTFRTNNNNRRNFYQQSCDKIQKEWWTSATESFQAIFSEDFDEEKRKNWLASFWITWATNSSETVHNLAENANTNKVILEKFLSDNNLKVTTDPTKKAELDTYIQWKNEENKSIEISDLKSHTERFMPNNPQTNPNPQNPDTQNNQNIELKNNVLKAPVERWLSTIFNHFQREHGSIIKVVGIKQSSIKDFSPWITNDITSKICKVDWKTVTLDLSDNNIRYVYDNFINKFSSTKWWPIKGKIQSFNRNWLKEKLKEWGLKWEINKCNKRKNNFSIIFDSLFREIIPTIQSQWWDVKIASNWQSFNNVKDAIAALQILTNPYS